MKGQQNELKGSQVPPPPFPCHGTMQPITLTPEEVPSQAHLVIVRDDGGDLPTGEHHVLPGQLVDSPGAGVERVVESVVAAETPVPFLQAAGLLYRQHLLVDGLALPAQADGELVWGCVWKGR